MPVYGRFINIVSYVGIMSGYIAKLLPICSRIRLSKAGCWRSISAIQYWGLTVCISDP